MNNLSSNDEYLHRLRIYIYDIPETDHLSTLMKRRAVTKLDHVAPTWLHISQVFLFHLLHRLNIRPPL